MMMTLSRKLWIVAISVLSTFIYLESKPLEAPDKAHLPKKILERLHLDDRNVSKCIVNEKEVPFGHTEALENCQYLCTCGLEANGIMACEPLCPTNIDYACPEGEKAQFYTKPAGPEHVNCSCTHYSCIPKEMTTFL